MSPKWKKINLGIIVILMIAAIVVGIVSDEINFLFGYSLASWFFSAVMLSLSFFQIYRDISSIETHPIYFSSWLFPVYVYNPSTN